MTRSAHTQQGMALIEALIASAVLGIGLVGATQLTLKTLHMASESRQHTVAQHLAQEAMDCLHARASVCPGEEKILVQGVRYTRQARSTARGNGQIQDLQVSVSWAASGNNAHGAALSSASADKRIEWHSSVSAVPAWVTGP
jgi:type IV pilus modification protein PilV